MFRHLLLKATRIISANVIFELPDRLVSEVIFLSFNIVQEGKMMMKKQILTIAIFILWANVSVAANCVSGEENCWDCAKTSKDNCTARLANGVLTISGTGKMKSLPDHSDEYCAVDNQCWNHLKDDITSVIVEEGITELGSNAFEKLSITSVSLPSTLKTLNREVFQNSSLTYLDLPEGLETFGGRMFYNNGSYSNPNMQLESIVLPDSLINSGGLSLKAFENSPIQTIYCPKGKEKFCADYIDSAVNEGYIPAGKLGYEVYEKYGDTYLYDGRFYQRLGDIGSKVHFQKRIYTIDEANKIAGKKNKLMIRYR